MHHKRHRQLQKWRIHQNVMFPVLWCLQVALHCTTDLGTIFHYCSMRPQSDQRAHLKLWAAQGRKCFPWQMHVELPLEHITTTISVTPSLISKVIGLLSNGHEGPALCTALRGKMWWIYVKYGMGTFQTIWEFTMEKAIWTHSFCFATQRLNIMLFDKDWHSFLRGEFSLKFRVCRSLPTDTCLFS